MLFNVLPGGDGIMVLRLHIGEITETLLYVQLFHTDSGHYMMPISDFGNPDPSEQGRLKGIVKQYFRTMTKTTNSSQMETATFLADVSSKETPECAPSGAFSGEDTCEDIPTSLVAAVTAGHGRYTREFYKQWRSFKSEVYSVSGDQWPKHWMKAKCQEASKYYRAMPEEFYTFSGLPVVTADNLAEWAAHMLVPSFDALEVFSGSGRLSKVAFEEGRVVGPPLDHRYMFDKQKHAHQDLADKLLLPFSQLTWWSPRCTYWTAACLRAGKDRVAEKRAEEEPTLK